MPSFRNSIVMGTSMVLSASLFMASNVQSAVIDFGDPASLQQFNQVVSTGTASFFTYDNSGGRNGSGGLKAATTTAQGWAIYSMPINIKEDFTASVTFLYTTPTVAVNGSSIYLGIAPSDSFLPNTGTSADPDKNHFAAALQVRPTGTTGIYNNRAVVVASNAGAVSTSTDNSDFTLQGGQWYSLELTSSWSDVTGTFKITSSLYKVEPDGVLTPVVGASYTNSNIKINAFDNLDEGYLYFGIPGQSVARGISGIDSFESPAIPESSTVALVLLGGAFGAASLRFRRKNRL